MSEQTPKEKITIPELPPSTVDGDSFLADVISGEIKSATELVGRFNTQNGYAFSKRGEYLYKDQNGQTNVDRRGNAIREVREAPNPEQRILIEEVANITEQLSLEERSINLTVPFLEDILSGAISTAEELVGRFNAQNGYAFTRRGEYLYKDQNGEVNTERRGNAIREVREAPNPKRQEIAKKTLQSRELLLSGEESFVSTASFLNDVLSGVITSTNELEGRLRSNNGYAFSKRGEYLYKDQNGQTNVDRRGNAIREVREAPASAQREIIFRVLATTLERAARTKTSKAGSLASKIVEGTISPNEMSRQIIDEDLDKAVGSELSTLINLRGTIQDTEIDALLQSMFADGDDTLVLERIKEERDKYTDISDEGSVRASVGAVQEYLQTARRINVRAKFWKQAEDPNAELGQLERYEEVDLNDTELVRELRSDALALRRDRLITNTYNLLAQPNPNYQSAAVLAGATANVIGILKDEASTDVLTTLVNDVYDSELRTIFEQALMSLGVDQGKVDTALARLEEVDVRPAIAGINFFEKFAEKKEILTEITEDISQLVFEQRVVELRKRFLKDGNVQDLITTILELPDTNDEDVNLRQNLLDELTFSVAATKGLNPARFALLREIEVEGIRTERPQTDERLDLAKKDPERNAAAVKNVIDRYQSNIMPLFEALRGGVGGDVLVDRYVSGKTGNRADYVQRVDALSEQRDLTDIETAYLESVQLLTVFNPHLVALLREQPELTSLYLENHFSQLDKETKDGLIPDAFIPVLQIGLGPSGLAAAGELNRANPNAASQTLYVDAASYPGGPFGIAKGQSWELNSANSISPTTNVLPDLSALDENGATVRSYGSPLVSYPGERKVGSDVRQGSINVTVDYLPNPDNISSKRYPTNVDLARVLQLQAAMLTDNMMLSTRVTKVSPIDDGNPGNKRVTLEYRTAEGNTIVNTIRTDSIVVAGGLGEPNYGIELAGSQAERIIAEDEQLPDRFPRLSDTIEAFSILSNPEGTPVAPKGSIAIYGGGNSADVLIEYLGRQFESGNPNLSGINKVYVITNAELSRRPRYAQINDLKSRNGQASFLEIVPARVRDVKQDDDGKLELLDSDGVSIERTQDGEKRPIRVDHVIAASGFRPMLDDVFKDLLVDNESLDTRQGLDTVRLASNPGFSIADTLINDPSVVIVGTASRADFKNANKLGQLPPSAREALLRNGAENAVAIGFRTPDTRAAIRQQFEGKPIAGAAEIQRQPNTVRVDIAEQSNERVVRVATDINRLPQTRRDVESDSDTLSALFLSSLPALELVDAEKSLVPSAETSSSESPRLAFTAKILFDEASASFVINGSEQYPVALGDAIAKAVENPYFQAYALKALNGRRTNRGLEVSLAFNRGKLQYRDPGVVDGKGRTYVEVL